jgi:hypothetical protein
MHATCKQLGPVLMSIESGRKKPASSCYKKKVKRERSMKIFRAVLSAAFSASLCACYPATSPVSVEHAAQVPRERILSTTYAHHQDNAQAFVFVRDSGMLNSALYDMLWVDGEKVAELDPKERITIFLQPGQHLVTIGWVAKGNAAMGPSILLKVPSDKSTYRILENNVGQAVVPME